MNYTTQSRQSAYERMVNPQSVQTAAAEARGQSADTPSVKAAKSVTNTLGTGGNVMTKPRTTNINGTAVTPNGAQLVYGTGDTKPTLSDTKMLSRDTKQVQPDTRVTHFQNTQITPDGAEIIYNGAPLNRADGSPVVAARDYLSNKGVGGDVQWSSGKPYYNGVEIPYRYVDGDNHVFASQSVLDDIYNEYLKTNGVKSEAQLSGDIWSKYNDRSAAALAKVTDRQPWSYKPRNDPAYLAYAREFARNAEQAYNRAMGSGGLYGRPTSYQQYQALAGYGDQMQRLSDTIPTLEQYDYSRYSDEQSRNLAAYNALAAERAAEHSAMYNANRDTLSRMRDNDERDYQREMADRYQIPIYRENISQSQQQTALGNDNVTRSGIDTSLYPQMAEYDRQIAQNQAKAGAIANAQTDYDNRLSRAVARNAWAQGDIDALGVPLKADGTYMTPEEFRQSQEKRDAWSQWQAQEAVLQDRMNKSY